MQYELLLLNVIRNSSEHSGAFKDYLGGHIIASYIAEFGFRAKVYSCDVLDCKRIITGEITNHNVKLLGFYVGADTRVMTGHIIKWVKDNWPEVAVLVGGPEAYSLEENFLHDTGCDYVVYGEGEIPVLNLLRLIVDGIGNPESIKSIKFVDTFGKIRVTPPEQLLYDLDAIPFPAKHNSLSKDFRLGESIGILTGRGCPYHCAFCFEGAASKSVRLRSIENVIAEIKSVKTYNPSLKYVNIYDDTFTLSVDRVREFCRYIKSTDLFWTCEAHVLMLSQNPEMIHMMADSGLLAVQLGIESGSRRVLDAYNKHITPEMIIDVVSECKSAGLHRVEGNYIIGGALESFETLRESIDHAKKLIKAGRGIIELNTVFFAPYYGTPITREPERYGMCIVKERMDHSVITMREAVIETESLSTNDIISAKYKFDTELRKQYMQEALLTTKSELLKGSGHASSGRIKNQSWLTAWRNYPYIMEFMRHLKPEEQECTSSSYPVRTMSEYTINEEIVSERGHKENGLDAKLIMLADGKNQIHEIASYVCLNVDELMNAYRSLNDKCLVYFSEF